MHLLNHFIKIALTPRVGCKEFKIILFWIWLKETVFFSDIFPDHDTAQILRELLDFPLHVYSMRIEESLTPVHLVSSRDLCTSVRNKYLFLVALFFVFLNDFLNILYPYCWSLVPKDTWVCNDVKRWRELPTPRAFLLYPFFEFHLQRLGIHALAG